MDPAISMRGGVGRIPHPDPDRSDDERWQLRRAAPVIDSLQLTANHKVATPAQWQPGDDVIIAGSVSNDEAKELFGEWDEPKPYIRVVPQPT